MSQYTKQGLCDAIFTAVCRDSSGMTRLQIARAIGLKKSPHVIAMIESLVTDGWLDKDIRTGAKGVNAFVYFISRKGEGITGACKDV